MRGHLTLAALLLVAPPTCALRVAAPRPCRRAHPVICSRHNRAPLLSALTPGDGAPAPAPAPSLAEENAALRARVAELEELAERTEGLCEVLDDGGGWTSSLATRASWLLGLLVCQSCSSFILADNEALLATHPVVVYFMTMLVGAGGNAGNQAAVRIIRGLATGEVDPSLTPRTAGIVSDELRRALALALIVVAAGFVRVVAFDATIVDAAAVSASLFLIVALSVVLGTLLPLALSRLRVDAAHASTTIQVVMDVMGVLITCTVAPLVFQAAASGGLGLAGAS
jgi:Mg/Co/Ni transporter MgtE